MTTGWKARPEAGSPTLLRAFAKTCLALGPRLSRMLLRPVCAYFLLTRRKERLASDAYLHRVLDRAPGWRERWRHFWTFSQVLLDRVFILGGKHDAITLQPKRPETLSTALDEGQGCILMGSHLGSFEASRAIKRARPEVQLRLVMDRQQSPAATRFLEALNPSVAEQVLDIGGNRNAGIALLNALEQGSLLALLADRARPGEKTLTVDFLGERAALPAGPFELAMVTQAPVVLFWGLHVAPGTYRVVFERFPTPPRVARGDRETALHASAQAFADRLAHHAREAPYNWFNFFDFWAHNR